MRQGYFLVLLLVYLGLFLKLGTLELVLKAGKQALQAGELLGNLMTQLEGVSLNLVLKQLYFLGDFVEING